MVQYKILETLQAPIYTWDNSETTILKDILCKVDLLIDALLGYNLQGNPRDPIATMIREANESEVPILAVDIPSGLQGDSGKPLSPTIKAHSTITLALPKVGLLTEKAKEYVGELYVADLSVPSMVYKKLGIDVPVLFEHEEVIKIP